MRMCRGFYFWLVLECCGFSKKTSLAAMQYLEMYVYSMRLDNAYRSYVSGQPFSQARQRGFASRDHGDIGLGPGSSSPKHSSHVVVNTSNDDEAVCLLYEMEQDLVTCAYCPDTT